MANLIHVISCDAERIDRRTVRARCGRAVADVPYGGPPTCLDCARLDAEDEVEFANLAGTQWTPPLDAEPIEPERCLFCRDPLATDEWHPYCSKWCAKAAATDNS